MKPRPEAYEVQAAQAVDPATPLFAVGDWVRISPHGQWDYEVAEVKMYPHGPMIGIYDEPPSKHVDFWNASSLTLSRTANA